MAKKRHIAAKLIIEPGQTVLDVGRGWGGLALYLAERCGAEVTGIMLSDEQLGGGRPRATAGNAAMTVKWKMLERALQS